MYEFCVLYNFNIIFIPIRAMEFLDWLVGIVLPRSQRISADGTPVPKKIIICHKSYFIKCICWSMNQLQSFSRLHVHNDGHIKWPKHVAGYSVIKLHKNTIAHFASLLVRLSRDRFPVVSLDFSVTYSFRPGVDSTPSENEYQEHFLGVKTACT